MIFSTMSPLDILNTETAFPEMEGRIPLSLTLSSYSSLFMYGQTEDGSTPFASFRISYDSNRYSVFCRLHGEDFPTFLHRIARSGAVRPVLMRNLEWVNINKCHIELFLDALYNDLHGARIGTLELNLSVSHPFDYFDFSDLLDILQPSRLSMYVCSHNQMYFIRLLREVNNRIPVKVLFASEKIRREVKAVLGSQLVE